MKLGARRAMSHVVVVLAATAAFAAPYEYWIPVVVSKPGAMGTVWRSEAAIVNTSCATPARLQAFFFGDQGAPQVSERSVAPSSQLLVSDLAGELFGVADVSGPVRILSPVPLVVTGRVFNQTPHGTLGQTMDAVEPATALTKGAGALLPALREDQGFRTNLQILNMGATAAVVEVRLVAGHRADTRTVTVPARRLLHLQQPLRPSLTPAPNAWAEVKVVEGDAVWPFASVVDNASGDATTMLPVLSGETTASGWFPVVARLPGVAGTVWRTALTVLNPSQGLARVTLRILVEGGAERQEAVEIAAGDQRRWDDLLEEVFGLTNAVGPLEFQADRPVAVTARVFNQTAAGTFGQSVPVVTDAASLPEGATAVMPFLRQGAFRSNVDVFNAGATEARVRLALFADGSSAGASLLTVPARRRLRIDQVFLRRAGLDSVANGFAFVSVESGTAVSFTGSVVDQATGDPTTVVARRVEMTSPPSAAFSFQPSPVAAGATVQFQDRSTCFPHRWTWEFDGGLATSHEPRPRFAFTTPGVHTVRLTAGNRVGNSLAVTESIHVDDALQARFVFQPSPTAVGVPVKFEDRSDGPVSTWYWEFGDGSTSRDRNPSHAFSSEGVYPVSLTVSGGGITSSHTAEISVRAVVAGFEFVPRAPRVGEPVQFEDRSLGGPKAWRWTFGDGTGSTEANPRHTFAGGGPYEVSLVVSNDLGEDRVSRSVAFIPDVSFLWSPPVPEAGEPVILEGTSTATVDWWAWNLGDGSALAWTQNASHSFLKEGRYGVGLTAANQAGTAWKGELLKVRGECAVPAAPTLASLDGAAASCPYYLRWSPTSPHHSYELQEGRDPLFAVPVTTFSVEGRNESPQLSHNVATDTTYYYRVRARAGDYCDRQWSAWSAVVALTVGPNQPCQVRVFTLPGGASFEMVRIPAGTFEMGSPPSEAGRLGDETQHRVTISRDFYIGRHEVTQRLWREVVGRSASRFPECGDDCPEDSVSWFAVCGFRSRYCGENGGFVLQLNQLLGLQEQPWRFRLPTEAEWEYAARAGNPGPYSLPVLARPSPGLPLLCDGACGGCPELDAQAWWCANSLDGTRPVGGKLANPWGLYDVHGGLAEWVEDWYGPYPAGPVTDPIGGLSGSHRVLRGGAWFHFARLTRSAMRFGDIPGFGDFAFGARLVYAEPLALPAALTNAPTTTWQAPLSLTVPPGPPLPTEVERRR